MSARNCSRSSACQPETPAGRRGFAVRSATNRGRFAARTCAGRRTFDGSFMCAPMGGRNGPVGAHPRKDGALLERWRAQCGVATSLYRNRRCRVFAAGTQPSQRILDASHRFPEPCGHVGPQLSPKHVAGEPMKSFSPLRHPRLRASSPHRVRRASRRRSSRPQRARMPTATGGASTAAKSGTRRARRRTGIVGADCGDAAASPRQSRSPRLSRMSCCPRDVVISWMWSRHASLIEKPPRAEHRPARGA